ncbi:MAG: transcriptional repressor [Alphaproteobacteria bacterium]|nr:transcriptional repressor [Alphaproteobacteria bacterium]
MSHDHAACMAPSLKAAENLGAKLTPLRRRVLEIVLAGHTPMGAYDVLATLARDGGKPAPPTVYRALDFLQAQGLVHRIDSRNAFVACFAPERSHQSRFFLCRACGRASEIEDAALDAALAAAAKRAGLTVERETIEITGVCAECASSHGPAA